MHRPSNKYSARRVPHATRRTQRKLLERRSLFLERLENRNLFATVSAINFADESYFGDTSGGDSVLASATNLGPSVTADGQRILFQSAAPDLVPNDFNNATDVFLYDRGTGAVTLVTGNAQGTRASQRGGFDAVMTPDGRYVVFRSDSNDMTSNPINNFFFGQHRIFWKDLVTGEVRQVNVTPDGADTGAADSASISDDGRYVLFRSLEGNAITPSAGMTSNSQYFLRDMTTGTTELVSRTAAGQFANRGMGEGRISGDGSTVVFETDADDLDPRDANTASDLFAYDVATRQVRLVTVSADGSAAAGGQPVIGPRPISADGRYVVYHAFETTAVTQNTAFQRNAFLFDRVTQTTTLLSANVDGDSGTDGMNVSITANGQWVTFLSGAPELPTGVDDSNNNTDVILSDVRNLSAITHRLVSANAAGNNGGNDHSGQSQYPFDFSGGFPQATPDGRFVVFEGSATDLASGVTDANDGFTAAFGNFRRDVFVRDTLLGQTRYVSISPSGTTSGNNGSYTPVISADGSIVAFESLADDLAPGQTDGNRRKDVLVRDLNINVTELASVRSPFFPTEIVPPDGYQSLQAVTPDGRYVLFTALSPELAPEIENSSAPNLYLADRTTGAIELVSLLPDGSAAGSVGSASAISADGRFVAFWSEAALNADVDPVGRPQLYRRDLITRTTVMVTVSTNPEQGSVISSFGGEQAVAMSADGRFITWHSDAGDLIPGFVDNNGAGVDVFVRDMALGVTRLASHAASSLTASGDGTSLSPQISADGSRVAFLTAATNVQAGVTDVNGEGDLAIFSWADGSVRYASVTPAGTSTGNLGVVLFDLASGGEFVAFQSRASNLTSINTNDNDTAYRRDLVTGETDLVAIDMEGGAANSAAWWPSISGDGRVVIFESRATDLVTIPIPQFSTQVYARDYGGATPVTSLVTVRVDGTAGAAGDSSAGATSGPMARITDDGRYVAFLSESDELTTEYVDANGGFAADLFLRDLAIGRTVLASPSNTGTTGADAGIAAGQFGRAGDYFIAANKPVVVFDSPAANLVNGDRNGESDLLAFEVVGGGVIAGSILSDPNGDGVSSDAGPGPGNALLFSASGGYVRVPNHASIDPTAAGTLSAWVKFDYTPSALNRTMSIVGTPGYDQAFELIGGPETNKFRFYAGSDSIFAESTTEIQAGVWYHVAGTYTANGSLRLYVNGQLEGTVAIPGITRTASGNPLEIGGSSIRFLGQRLEGTVDEVQVWNIARSASDIQATFNRQLTGTETGLSAYYTFAESNGRAVVDRTGKGRDGEFVGYTSLSGGPVRLASTAPLTGPAGQAGGANLEPGLAYWRVYLDANGNRLFDPGETSVQTDAYGEYRFTNLAAGNYSVRAVLPNGFRQTAPLGDLRSRSVTLSTDASRSSDNTFFVQRAPADLDVTLVTAPATATPGRPVTVTWQVRNAGDSPVTAATQDAVYLSADDTLDSSDLLVATFSRSSPLAAGDIYSGSATFELPAVASGSYRVFVVADRRYQTPNENNRANNIEASSATMAVSVPTLAVGASTSGVFAPTDANRYFRVSVARGQTVVLTLDSASASGATELFLARNRLPSFGDFDDISVVPGPDQTLVLRDAQPGDYYVLARGRSGGAASAAFTLSATAATFGLTGIDTPTGGAGGRVTVEVRGNLFTPSTVFTLVRGGVSIAAATVDFRDSGLAYVTFDLTSVTPATFDLRAVDGANQSVLSAAFQATSPPLAVVNPYDIRLITPAALRQGRTSSVLVRYTNTTNVDQPAPLLELRANTRIRLAEQASFSGAFNVESGIDFLAIASDGPAGVLRPGQTGEQRIFFQTEPGEGGVDIQFSVNILDPQGATSVDWNAFKAAMRPSTVPTDAWDAIFANFLNEVGATTGDYVRLLGANATYLGNLGIRTADVGRLIAFEMLQASAGLIGVQPVTVTDATLATPGADLLFVRSFRGDIAGRYQVGPFGRGWSHNWDTVAATDGGGNVTIRQGSGYRYFSRLADGSYLGAAAETAVLTVVAGRYQLRAADGTVTQFRADGRLDFVEDRNGNRVTAGFDGDGRLVTLSHNTAGVNLTLAYNAAGRIASLTESTGRTVTYAYDVAGQHLTGYTDRYGSHSYSYVTGQGNAREHALAEIAYADGTHLRFAYDTLGRVIEQKQDGDQLRVSFAYDAAGGVAITPDASGPVSILFNDAARPELVRDALGRTTRYDYDANDQLAQLIIPSGATYAYTYCACGVPTSITDPLGRTVRMSYDDEYQNLVALTDAKGITTNYGYDDRGNLAAITYADGSRETFTADPLGNVAAASNRRGRAISYQYDVRGRLTGKTFADGVMQTYEYDARDNLIKATEDGQDTLFEYDSVNDTLTQVTYPNGRFLRFEYNSAGQRTSSVDQDGFTTNYAYDALGRLDRLTDGNGALVVDYDYDPAGIITRRSNGNGTATTYVYDSANQLIELTHLAPGGTVNSKFVYAYDVDGQRISSTLTDNTAATADGTTTYGYDAIGQLTSITLPNGRTIAYQYDVNGNRTRVVDSLLGTTDYESNVLNQVTRAGETTFVYDPDGNLIRISDGTSVTSFTYDDENQLIASNGPNGSFRYEYNAFGVRDAFTHDGVRTEFLIDPTSVNRVAAEYGAGGSLLANYRVGLGLASRVATGGSTSYYDFDAMGNTVGLTNAAGVYVNRYSYLPFGETTVVSAGVPNLFQFVGQFGVQTPGDGLKLMTYRNYSPLSGQFTSDDPIGIAGGDVNVRRFVGNRPIQFVDPQGTDGYYVDANGNLVKEPDNPLIEWMKKKIVDDKPTDGRDYDFPTSPDAKSQGEGFLKNQKRLTDQFDGFLNLPNFRPWGSPPAPPPPPPPPSPPLPPPPPAVPRIPFGDWISPIIRAFDPNDITGPAGVGAERFVRVADPMPYTIRFENISTATAPAQEVFVTHQLDADLDFNTFQLGDFGWGGVTVDVPDGLQSFITSVETANLDGSPLIVDVTVEFVAADGRVIWTFRSRDPQTGLLPEDAFAGFLPPNDSTGRGNGFVTYKVFPRTDRPNGTAIDQQASIVFDTNNPIVTNIYSNQLDTAPPTSAVLALPAATSNTTFVVSWAGSDVNGSGVASYDVYVSDNGQPFVLWQSRTAQTTASYSGQINHEYRFFSVAYDRVGHAEPTPGTVDAQVLVTASPWRNPRNPLDVDDSGSVVPRDALLVIGELNDPQIRDASGRMPVYRMSEQQFYLDVTGDGFLVPLDALLVINFINGVSEAEGEAEGLTSWFRSLDAGLTWLAESPAMSVDASSPTHASSSQLPAAPLATQGTLAWSVDSDQSTLVVRPRHLNRKDAQPNVSEFEELIDELAADVVAALR
ncbi:MAG: LamG-like jellyroll fold domain-containing protein [Pirellulales bacterium]